MAEEKKTDQAPRDLMGFLDFYLVKKAPFQIPDSAKEWIVKFGPWITVVLIVISLPALLLILGVGSFLVPFGGYGYASAFGVATIALILQLGLELAALPGLFARKMSGWNLLFYSQVVSFVYSILSQSYVSAIVGVIVGLYLLFQIREKYTK